MLDYRNACPTCGGPTVALFFSVICERCDARSAKAVIHRGYIIWRSRPPGSTEYVFRHHDSAETWRASASLGQFPIRAVNGPAPFTWRVSSGSCTGIEIAEGVYEVYTDDRHEPGPRRVHLVPD